MSKKLIKISQKQLDHLIASGRKNFSEYDLRGLNLRGADLREADFTLSDLRGADFTGANLRRADFREADLRKVNLRNADLGLADLRHANLRKADLRDANFAWAKLQLANLQEADLRGVDIENQASLQYVGISASHLYSGRKTTRADLTGAIRTDSDFYDQNELKITFEKFGSLFPLVALKILQSIGFCLVISFISLLMHKVLQAVF